jgi:RHS repeat-associated protein
MVKNNQTYKIMYAPLGSIRLIFNSQGDVVQELEYDEFGMVLRDTNPGFQPLGYNSGIYDQDTQLVRFGARDYDPMIGRWTTKDPIGFAGGDTNLYSYVGQNPTSFIDPTGLARGDWLGSGVAHNFLKFRNHSATP